jgi:hypothetical protein
MNDAYKDDKALCSWLRENSSGACKLSAFAAERIETLSIHLYNVQRVCDQLECLIKSNKKRTLPLSDDQIEVFLNIISPERFNLLADWIDVMTPENPNTEVQDDLRKMAKMLNEFLIIIDHWEKDMDEGIFKNGHYNIL